MENDDSSEHLTDREQDITSALDAVADELNADPSSRWAREASLEMLRRAEW